MASRIPAQNRIQTLKDISLEKAEHFLRGFVISIMDDPRQNHSLRATAAWQSYRRAFDNFRSAVRTVQNLSADGNPAKATVDAAVLNMQQAHEDYRCARDTLARELIPSIQPGFAPRNPSTRDGVKEVAELLWELEGRPDGTALDDWYRAENIVRRAAAPCPGR